MSDDSLQIVPYDPAHLEEILDLSILAWSPVFPEMEKEIPNYVYEAFYPDGWQARQRADIASACGDDETDTWVALTDDRVSGFLGLRVHEEDSMGEIYVIAVHPEYQRQGIGSALISFAIDRLRQHGLSMVMVETGGDAGHSRSRACYENAGFERYPVARYFRKL